MSFSDIPKYGWRVKFDYLFPEIRSQKLSATWRQILHMIPLFLRYLVYWAKKRLSGNKPVMDFLEVAKNYGRSGIPIGGIGGGCIGRGFRGEFFNTRMLPGQYYPSEDRIIYFILTVQNINNITIYQSVLTGQRTNQRKMSSWEWNIPPNYAEYTALYPRSWTEYNIPEIKLSLICRQINPIIPHNYKDSCIPGGVFEWIIKNYSENDLNISITFTMSSIGNRSVKPTSELFQRSDKTNTISGIMIHESNTAGKYTFALAALKKDNINITRCSYFNPNGNGSEIWETLRKNGELNLENIFIRDKELGVAVCCKSLVKCSTDSHFTYSLTWDMPIIKFPCSERSMKRYYTKFFGDSGNVAPDLSFYSLINYPIWEESINKWQKDILEADTPEWYKSALFNELYYVSYGGTIWLLLDDKEIAKLPSDDPRIEYGRFGYLEGVEYKMYNTYDVHFYASVCLAMLWPKLEISLQYDFRDTIDYEDTSKIWYLANGKIGYRKTKDTVPHDLGDSCENPYGLINSYPIHDVSNWKDLNLKFVLQIYRDYIVSDAGLKFIQDMFNEVTTVMRYALQWDIDDDGMIENSGEADQTYDCWVMCGTSAYCGSLWLAALIVFTEMASILKEDEILKEFKPILLKAAAAFDKKLWNGKYYNFDSSNGSHSNSIMADQLCGLWYLNCCNIMVDEKIFPKERVKQALSTVYSFNVKSYYNGSQGAVNGMKPDYTIDDTSVQSEEVWTGVTYALASLLYYQGMTSEAFTTAEGIYKTVYDRSGLGFATPEALHGLNSFRSLSYMRPLSIWSIQLAIQNSKNNIK
ncbi:hypothetical protein O3M35_004097 [Rhynocoris fuscipes]|uniref:Non-lysosomal glucosylceramidase n=1 Tax=Rhynocoris fuscipes TaxID=488301 RepID=A0AAW1CHC6_9HEMI